MRDGFRRKAAQGRAPLAGKGMTLVFHPMAFAYVERPRGEGNDFSSNSGEFAGSRAPPRGRE